MKYIISDLNCELINKRKNEVNTRLLSAIDSLFVTDQDNMDVENFVNSFQNFDFCNGSCTNINNNNINNDTKSRCRQINTTSNYNNNSKDMKNVNLKSTSSVFQRNFNNNSNNDGVVNNIHNKDILSDKNLKPVLKNPILIGTKNTQNFLKNYLENDRSIKPSDSTSVFSIKNHELGTKSISDTQSNSNSYINTGNTNSTKQNYRECSPIECVSSKCADTLMKYNLPEFVKTKTCNETPSLTIAELEEKTLRMLTRINKKNEYGAEQFITFKYDVNLHK